MLLVHLDPIKIRAHMLVIVHVRIFKVSVHLDPGRR